MLISDTCMQGWSPFCTGGEQDSRQGDSESHQRGQLGTKSSLEGNAY
jgi:hypothetical protein